MGIYKRGAVFWAQWVEDGERHRKSLGTKDRWEAEIRFEDLTSKDASLTVREILRLWLGHQTSRCKPHSIEIYKIAVKRFSFVWGDLHPEEITTLLVERFQERAIAARLGPRTINQQVGTVMSALKWAHDRELIEVGPPKWTRLKVREKHSRKYLTASEIQKLLTTVCKARWKRLEPIVRLSLYAGLRQQEAAWLEWSDLDEEGWLHVRSKQGWSPKSSSSIRSIPIADELAAYLTSIRKTCRWVAPMVPGKRWKQQHLGVETRQLFRAAGVDDGGPQTLHRLRGTFATTVLRGGGDLESLRQVLGHSALSVTAGYLSATSESKRRAVGGLSFNG